MVSGGQGEGGKLLGKRYARDTAGNITANVCHHEACMFVESDKLKK